MFSLPTNKTGQLWVKIYSSLNFDADGKMLFKLCSRRAEQNGTVNTINSKFVQGSKNYQLSSIRDHDASKSHAAAKTAKEDFDAHKTGLSVPPRNTIKYRQVGSAIAKSMQQMSDKDWETVTIIHDIANYIALYGLPFTQFEYHIQLEKLHNVSYTGAYENETACKNFILDISDCFFQQDITKKMELVNLLLFCATDLQIR